jgi:hypothetical protein
MGTKHHHPTTRRRRGHVLLSLLLALSAWTSACPQARTGDIGSAPLRSQKAHMYVTVNDGTLSVDLREAPVQEVLAMISQQAGLRVRIDAAATRMVSAQFAAMALDQGLRRLLRGASLSYALRYTRGPTATAVLDEVRVFGETRREELANQDQVSIQLAERAPAQLTSSPQEKRAELLAAEPEPEGDAAAEPESTEPAADGDVPED